VRKILAELRPLITMLPETLPQEIIKDEKLLNRSDALLAMHFPENYRGHRKGQGTVGL